MMLLTKNDPSSIRLSTRRKTFLCRFLFVLAVAIFAPWTSLTSLHIAQVAQNSAPELFNKCWESPNVTVSSVYASDKNNSFFLLDSENKIASVNILDGLTNWTYEISGQNVSNFIIDGNSLYVANRSYKNHGDDKNDDKNNNDKNNEEKVNENTVTEKIYLRSINIASGVPYWSTEIDFLKSETSERNDSIQAGAGGDEMIILGRHADGLFLFDKKGHFAFVQKRQGFLERSKKLDIKPSFFLGLEFNAAQEIQEIDAGHKVIAFHASGSVYLAETRSGEIIGRAELPESPAAGLLLDLNNFVVGDEKGNITSFTLENKGKWRRVWSVKVGGSISGLTPADETLLATSFDNFVYLLNRNNGKKIWKKRLSGRLVFEPLLSKKDNRLIVIENNNAYLISLKDGKLSNQFSLPPDEYFINKPISINNRYIFQTNRRIISFSDSDKGCS